MAFIPKPRQSDEDNNASMQQGGNGQWQKGPTAFNRPPPPASRGPGLSTAKAPGRLPPRSNAPSMSGNPNSPMAGGGDFGRFVSLGEYLGQNQSQAQGMANKVGNAGEASGKSAQQQVQGMENSFNGGLQQANKAQFGNKATSMPGGKNLEAANPNAYAQAVTNTKTASDYNTNLGNTGGVQTNLQDVYSQAGHSAGEGMWDAAQAQQAGGGRFAQLASRYGNLSQALTDANTRSENAYNAMGAGNAAWDAEQERLRLQYAQRAAEAARMKSEARYKAAVGDSQMDAAQTPGGKVSGNKEKAETKKDTGTKGKNRYND